MVRPRHRGVCHEGQRRGNACWKILEGPGCYLADVAAIVDAVCSVTCRTNIGKTVFQGIAHPDIRSSDRTVVGDLDLPGDLCAAVDRLSCRGNSLGLGHCDIRDSHIEIEHPDRCGVRIAAGVVVACHGQKVSAAKCAVGFDIELDLDGFTWVQFGKTGDLKFSPGEIGTRDVGI